MSSGPFNAILDYSIRDFSNDFSVSYQFKGCSFNIDGFNFQNCLEHIEINGQLFENVIVLQEPIITDDDEPRITLMNSESGLVYADLDGSDFIKIITN